MIGTGRFKAAFTPTVDCAILVAAVEKGFDADEGLSLELLRKTSTRDILTSWDDDALDGAHLPASVPVASALAHPEIRHDLIAPFVVATGGSSLVVSQTLHDDLFEQGMKIPDPGSVSRALARVAIARREAGLSRLVFAVENILSPSFFELRYLLASALLLSPRDIEIIEADAADMPALLGKGTVDGIYVAEPYGSAAVLDNGALMVTTKSHIWQNAPEKVLAVSRHWAEENAATLQSLLRALYRAGEWCASNSNIEELAGLLASPRYLSTRGELILPALTGFLPHSPARLIERPGFLAFAGNATNFPWQSHALWFFDQMLHQEDRGGQATESDPSYSAAVEAYCPDIFRSALKPIFAPVPSINLKVEGTLSEAVQIGASRGGLMLGPDAFFDGRIFDPETLKAKQRS